MTDKYYLEISILVYDSNINDEIIMQLNQIFLLFKILLLV